MDWVYEASPPGVGHIRLLSLREHVDDYSVFFNRVMFYLIWDTKREYARRLFTRLWDEDELTTMAWNQR